MVIDLLLEMMYCNLMEREMGVLLGGGGSM